MMTVASIYLGTSCKACQVVTPLILRAWLPVCTPVQQLHRESTSLLFERWQHWTGGGHMFVWCPTRRAMVSSLHPLLSHFQGAQCAMAHLKKIFFNVYLFLRERQSSSRGGAEREGDTESGAGSRLRAVSTEPDVGLELKHSKIMTESPRCPWQFYF